MVQKKMRATSLNGNEGHVFKLSAAVVFVVNKRSLSAVAIRCSVAQSDDGVGVVRRGGAKKGSLSVMRRNSKKNAVLNTAQRMMTRCTRNDPCATAGCTDTHAFSRWCPQNSLSQLCPN